jgi:hypothetical protein
MLSLKGKTKKLLGFGRTYVGQSSGEYLVGGIFLVSNMANSTAVWNSKVHDTFGDVICKHGGLERCRDLLGKPKILDAGELVWITDRTPHESLPLTDLSKRRHFFRLVVGEISYWFADHSTVNPTGFKLPSTIPIVHGDKFTLSREVPTVWRYGSKDEMKLAHERAKFRKVLYEFSIGFLADTLARRFLIYDRNALREKENDVTNYLSRYLRSESESTIHYVNTMLARIIWET